MVKWDSFAEVEWTDNLSTCLPFKN